MGEIILAKLITGEWVIGVGKRGMAVGDQRKDFITKSAVVQFVPTASGGVQFAMTPYGFPFESDFTESGIPFDAVVYFVEKIPSDFVDKYLEVTSGVILSSQSGGVIV